jgi:hypothetical protein
VVDLAKLDAVLKYIEEHPKEWDPDDVRPEAARVRHGWVRRVPRRSPRRCRDYVGCPVERLPADRADRRHASHR